MSGHRFKEKNTKSKLNWTKVIIVLIIPFVFLGIWKISEFYMYKSKTVNIKRINNLAYFTTYRDGKYGVINSKGEEVIKNKYEELIVIPDALKEVFVVSEITDLNKGEYQTKVINSNENEIIKNVKNVTPIEYDSKNQNFDKNLLIFKRDGKYGLVDFEGVIKFEPTFEEILPLKNIEGKLKVKQDGKYGVINTKTSNYTVPAIYKLVEPIYQNTDTSYKVVFDDKYGVITTSALQILKTEYDSIENIPSSDYIVANKGGQKKIYNIEGKEIGTSKFNIKNITKEQLLIIEKNGKYGVNLVTGKEILEAKYEEIIKAGKDKYIVKEAGKYNIVESDKEGNTELEKRKEKKLSKDYDKIEYIENGDIYILSSENNESVLDSELQEKYSNVLVLETEKDYLRIIDYENSKEEKLLDYKFNELKETNVFKNNNLIRFKENGKYGYKDLKDQVIVSPIYDDAKYQNEYGYIAVNRAGKWGVLNYLGEVIIEPKMEFKDHLIIDFIDKWFRDKDTELNVFVKTDENKD